MYYSPTNPNQRGSYFAIHYLPYIMLFLCLSALCCAIRKFCVENKHDDADENNGSAIVHGQVPLLTSQIE